jgi:CheY-like chemotaxis protein
MKYRSRGALSEELGKELARRKGAHILVAEDNEINQQIIRQLLLKVGLDATIVGMASEAFVALEEQRVDLILMDIQMPQMDGLEATRHIRRFQRFANLPIVAMTGHALEHDRQLSLAAGMNDHLTKPINPVEFYRTIVRWIAPVIADSKEADAETAADAQGTADPVSTSEIAGINVGLGVDKVGGNHQLYRELLRQFHRRNIGTADEIRRLIEENQLPQAREQLHAFKGVAGNLGAERLFEAARGLEQLLTDATTGKITAALASFNSEFQQLMGALEQLTTEMGEAQPQQSQIDYETVARMLQELAEQIDHDLGRAVEIGEELKAYLNDTVLASEYAALEDALSDFNADAVKAAIRLLNHKMVEARDNG